MPITRWLRTAAVEMRRARRILGPGPFRTAARLPLVLALLGSGASVQAYEVTDWLSVGGVVAAGSQCQLLTDGGDDACRGALPIQTELSVRPSESDEFFLKLGLAAGNGLNASSPFALAPWAADLRDDVKGINGRWSHLLNAWYAHRFSLGKGVSLRVTGGIIDSTDYLDDNVYSNDEYTQFMNEALVNGPNAFLPSYDFGGAVELEAGSWSARGVVMQIGGGDGGNGFTFWGTQLGYRAETSWGVGNYRILVVGAGNDFIDPTGTGGKGRFAVGFSADQQLGEILGAYLRIGWQDDSAAVTWDSIYSGGISIRGRAWGRPEDEIGLACGYLPGGNESLRSTHVAELYYRFVSWEYFAITADVQYMRDDLRFGKDPRGFILGLRFTAQF